MLNDFSRTCSKNKENPHSDRYDKTKTKSVTFTVLPYVCGINE